MRSPSSFGTRILPSVSSPPHSRRLPLALQTSPATKTQPCRNAAEQRAIRAFDSREAEPARTQRLPRPHAQGRGPSHASLRRHLRRNLHQKSRAARSCCCVDPARPELLQARCNYQKHAAAAGLRRRQRARRRCLQRPEALRCAGRLLLHAQLCPQRRHQRPRPVLRHLRPLRRHRQIPHGRMARRGRHPRRCPERTVPRNHGDSELRHAAEIGSSARLANARLRSTRNRTGDATGTTREDLSRLRDALLAAACATKSPSIARKSTTPSTLATRSKTAASPAPRTACSVKIRFLYQVLRASLRNRSSPRPCSASRSPRRTRASSASISCSLKTPTWPCPSTTGRC